ncbi:Fe2+-dependent dioxygenase [Erythrobacter sp.]|jgi:PKHD-type hydroxylase|uniref:Fe2+-dependent dioxygenase n=1 Tax=Erythrobacter sp. TaxID=1042 RepID=UPI002EA2EBCB|nr:Fe2+-dependent dioxygenase [Erythrobacter sp.]
MILHIVLIEEPERLGALRDAIARLEWQDGKATAGSAAGRVKHNEQAKLSGADGRQVRQTILDEIREHPVVQAAARPRRVSGPLISRMQKGGHYGAHTDNAFMGEGQERLRTDLSFTLFLNEPADYEGGELVVQNAGLTKAIKGAAGTMLLYPSTSIHEVRAVTSGTRLVAVGWIESLIRDAHRREMLFDLQNLRAGLRGRFAPDTPELLLLDKAMSNLLRMWS